MGFSTVLYGVYVMFAKSKLLSLITMATTLAFSATFAEEEEAGQNIAFEESQEEAGKVDIQKVSEAFGHLIGKNLDSLGINIDFNQVMKGMQDSMAGKESPMDETATVQAISLVQEEAFQELAKKNLDEANIFMAQNSKDKHVIELEKSKVEKQGTGTVVEEHFSPMIRYSGKFLDGKFFGASQEDELVALDEVIPGFRQGIVGMKEGEKRTLFIHPDLGYGTSGYLPPNSTLIFDIEVVKANATPQQEESITSIPSEETREIALPQSNAEEAIR